MKIIINALLVVFFLGLFVYGFDKQCSLDQINKGEVPTDCVFESNCQLKSFHITQKDLEQYKIKYQNELNRFNNNSEVIEDNGIKYLVSYSYYQNENNEIVKVKEDKEQLEEDNEVIYLNSEDLINYLAD